LHNTDNLPIIGQAELQIGDNVAFLFSRVHRLLSVAVLASTVIAAVIWLLALSNRQSAQYRSDPALGLKAFVSDALPIIVGYTGLFVAISIFFSWLSFRRLPLGNRQLTYHADAEALKTSDASGAVLTLPWTLIRKTRVTPKLLLMQLTSRAWRFVPLRAFSAADQQRLIALVTRPVSKSPTHQTANTAPPTIL
jgi:hypothetical protein